MELIVCLKLYREKFKIENYCDLDPQMLLLQEGKVWIKNESKEYIIEKNQAFIFAPDKKYFRKVLEPATFYLFRLKQTNQKLTDLKLMFKDTERIESDFKLLEALDQEIYADEFSLKNDILKDIINQYRIESGKGDSEKSTNPKIDSAIRYAINNLHKKITPVDMARETGYSYIHFSRLFKAQTTLTPSEFINRERYRRASGMLTETNLMIKDIATGCGFENEYYFSSFFKKQTGMSPSKFRKNMK